MHITAVYTGDIALLFCRMNGLQSPCQGKSAYLLEDTHDEAHILKVLHLPVQLQGGVTHVLVKGLQILTALLVQVLGILSLPRGSLTLERVLQWLCLKGQ